MTEPFRVLCADPPWRFGDKLPGKSRGADNNYPTLSIEELLAFPLPPLAPDALLFMWRVSSMVEEAYRIVRSWGFVPKSEMVWRKLTSTGKPHFGMGRYVRLGHESVIIARRGKAKVRNRSIRSVFSAAVGPHSAKPEAFYDLVESLSAGPYCELFGRRQREGWTIVGNQTTARDQVRSLQLFQT